MDACKTQIMHVHATPPVCVTVVAMKGDRIKMQGEKQSQLVNDESTR